MENNGDDKTSRLPVTLKTIDFSYDKPVRRNDLVDARKYNKIDKSIAEHAKLGTNGVLYVKEEAFSSVFNVNKSDAAYIYENQIPKTEKRSFDGSNYAHSSAVVGLVDKKSQEVRNAKEQAILQYSRDSLISVSDSPQMQDVRRQVDAFVNEERRKLKDLRGIEFDEVTGEPLRKGAAFHHYNPTKLHTDPEDSVDPAKGRNLNVETHLDVHRRSINDEEQFARYQKEKQGASDLQNSSDE